jgi:hypothetical protein
VRKTVPQEKGRAMYDATQILIALALPLVFLPAIQVAHSPRTSRVISILTMVLCGALAVCLFAEIPLMVPIDPQLGKAARNTLLAIEVASFFGYCVYKFISDFRAASLRRAERSGA